MWLADALSPQRRGADGRRRSLDALALGLAQACALVPGRLAQRRDARPPPARAASGREDANALSRHVALPVIVGATAAEGRAAGAPRPARAAWRARSRPGIGGVVRLDAAARVR